MWVKQLEVKSNVLRSRGLVSMSMSTSMTLCGVAAVAASAGPGAGDEDDEAGAGIHGEEEDAAADDVLGGRAGNGVEAMA